MYATSLAKVELDIIGCYGVLKLNGGGYFNASLLADLEIGLMQLLDDDQIRAIMIASSRPATFGYGFDKKELAQFVDSGRDQTEKFLRRWGQLGLLLENSSKPTCAAISGVCADAALELALACQYRIASATALMGFTEITNGLIPGMGGTQRLPRLVGVKKAMVMMVGAERKLVNAKVALADHLVDAVAQDSLAVAASQLVVKVLAGRSGISRSMPQDRELDRADFDSELVSLSNDKPVAAMNSLIIAVRNGMDQKDLTKALEIELHEFLDCLFLK